MLKHVVRYFPILLFLLIGSCGEQSAVVIPDVDSVTSTGSEQPENTITLQPIQPITILADGLQNPVGLTLLSDGGLLIAEEGSGERDASAGVMLVTADGDAGRLISGLPSGRDSGDLSGVPFVAVSPNGKTLYTSYFGLGTLLTLPLGDTIDVPKTPFSASDLGTTMLPFNAVKLVNPFDVAFDADEQPIVSDASANGVARLTADGRTQFFHRFEKLVNPLKPTTKIDPVSTGITSYRDNYLVTLTGGCPYPAGSGQLVEIDEQRNQRTMVDGLNMPIDVTVDANDVVWVLEFAQFDPDGSCFSGAGYLPNTGRLSRLRGGTLQPIVTELNFPGSVVIADDGTAYVSEVFAGRVLKIENLDAVEEAISAETILHKVNPLITIPPTSTSPDTSAQSPTAAFFVDQAAARGLNFQHGAFLNGLSMDPIAMMGGGLCWLDYDKDGWLDLYLVNSHAENEASIWQSRGSLPVNRLYRNESGRFNEVSAGSGSDLGLRGNGCVAADFDMDGWTDIYVTADGPNQLLWNNGDGTFTEGAAAAGVALEAWNSATAVADLNGDGFPEMFVASYINLDNKIEKPVGAFPQDFYGLPDNLFVNNGDRTFRDVTQELGLEREERGLGALFSDLDNDGDLELYIANDGQPNRLYSFQTESIEGAEFNQSNLGFALVDLSLSAETGDSGSGMGVTGGDFDNDGLRDLFVTNWDTELNALYRNEGGNGDALNFRYSTYRVGISGLGNNVTAWGTTWADFDHDTDQDLLVVHGHVPITDLTADAQLVRFYGNRLAEGKPNEWREWTPAVGLGIDGLGSIMARGSATADFDNDGDLDVAVNVIGGEAVLLVNSAASSSAQPTEQKNYLQIAFETFAANASAIATLPDGTQLTRELHVGSSYLASEDPRLHFGLGENSEVTQLIVRWGDQECTFTNVPGNQVITIP